MAAPTTNFTNVAVASLKTGGGTPITKIVKGTVAIDPASVAANAVADQTFTLTGAVVGDTLILNPPSGINAGLAVLEYYVSAANQITIRFHNTTGSPIDQASGNWTYCLIRS
jgi:hypothetical protein